MQGFGRPARLPIEASPFALSVSKVCELLLRSEGQTPRKFASLAAFRQRETPRLRLPTTPSLLTEAAKPLA
jgi:hypothetical protein